MSVCVKFKIADIIFSLTSRFPIIFKNDPEIVLPRYGNFVYHGKMPAKIKISVDAVEKLPPVLGKELFTVYTPGSRSKRWQLFEDKDQYIYFCPIRERKIIAYLNKDFSKAEVFAPPYKKELAWDLFDIIYDLMQIILINYFALRKNGLILHAAAVKENNRALIFSGKSGSGKSTTAKLWHANSRAQILDDDRVIVRKTSQGFYAYNSPWHGAFGNSIVTFPRKALLKRVFIIEHARKNFCFKLTKAEAFQALYPNLFCGFWNGQLMDNIAGLCEELIDGAGFFRLGSVKNKRVIGFVRSTLDKTS